MGSKMDLLLVCVVMVTCVGAVTDCDGLSCSTDLAQFGCLEVQYLDESACACLPCDESCRYWIPLGDQNLCEANCPGWMESPCYVTTEAPSTTDVTDVTLTPTNVTSTNVTSSFVEEPRRPDVGAIVGIVLAVVAVVAVVAGLVVLGRLYWLRRRRRRRGLRRRRRRRGDQFGQIDLAARNSAEADIHRVAADAETAV